MTALRLERQVDEAPPASPSVDPRLLPLLNHLRLVALACRVAARSDLYQACAVLSANAAVARDAYAETLMRSLAQALGQTPIFHRPGVHDTSFDEAWLMRLFAAAANGDQASFHFLIRSRVARPARRNLAYLVWTISEQFPLD
ncbi:MAG: hypothetical protein AAGE18_08380 [Pseudomonadota bacterium]